MNTFVLRDKGVRDTDIITEILKDEKICYRLESLKSSGYFSPIHIYGYNIWIYCDYEHFQWAIKLIHEKYQILNTLENSYELLSVDKKGKPITDEKAFVKIVVKQPKTVRKSMLKRIVDWVGEHV